MMPNAATLQLYCLLHKYCILRQLARPFPHGKTAIRYYNLYKVKYIVIL